MTDLEYMNQAEQVLRAVESAADRISDQSEADIDSQRVGGMVTLVFANGSQIVINLQKPLQEIWLAAKEGGYHYRWNGRAWICTRRGDEFFADLSRCASAQAGLNLTFS